MEVANIETRVIAIVAQQLRMNKEKIIPSMDFKKDLRADSIDITSILMRLEEEFNIHLLEGSEHQLTTIQDLITSIYRTRSKQELDNGKPG